jgi:hypothetical protein
MFLVTIVHATGCYRPASAPNHEIELFQLQSKQIQVETAEKRVVPPCLPSDRILQALPYQRTFTIE